MPSITLRAALAATLIAASAAGQSAWDSIPASATLPVHAEGALVVHDNGSDIFAFSATSRRFQKLAPTGAEIHTGDWTALLRTQDQAIFYSARLDNHVQASGIDPIFVRCEDDVALVISPAASGGLFAFAYSAVTGTVDVIPYTPTTAGVNVDVATSRFVIALRMKNSVWGFSARYATWIELPNVVADKPLADGNVGLVDIPSVTGVGGNAAAFSGVLGAWSISPNTHHTNVSLTRHNVAYVRADSTSALYKGAAYSAYNGTWVTSSLTRTVGSTTPHLTDNVVLLEGTAFGVPGLEGIGARPGLKWASYDPAAQVTSKNADFVISNDFGGKRVVSFSGLCEGAFDVMPFQSPTGFGAVLGAHSSFGIDQTSPQATHYGYSPHTNEWTVNPEKFVFSWSAEDAVIDCISHTPIDMFWAYSSRAGNWIPGPAYVGSDLHVIQRTGSVIAHQATAGPNAGEILMFDERASEWPPPYQPGFTSDMFVGRNILMLKLHDTARSVIGFSMQRGDWQPSPGAIGAPLVDPVTEENVAYYVDKDGTLCAFGAHADVHTYYQWPNGTEYQTTGVLGTPIPGSPSGTSWAGDPGESIWLLTALDAAFPGVHLFGWQNPICLDLGTLSVFGPFAVIGSSGVVGITAPMPPVSAPACFEFWVQGAFAGGGQGNRFGVRCDPRWVF